jgi:hypothetical protein
MYTTERNRFSGPWVIQSQPIRNEVDCGVFMEWEWVSGFQKNEEWSGTPKSSPMVYGELDTMATLSLFWVKPTVA